MIKHSFIQHIYHLADMHNWRSIQTHGLLSTAQLLKRTNQNKWLRSHRTESIYLSNEVMIRDQRPMPPSALSRCLSSDLTPEDWYAFLNQQVFFWIDVERLERQRKACNSPQYIMTIDAQKLLKHYSAKAAVTPFNTGNARRAPARRTLATFVPYTHWLNTGWKSEAEAFGTKPRSAQHKPVELTIKESVIDIFEYVIDYQLIK